MVKKLTIDFETRSAAPLKTCGAAAYAQHPTTEVICLAFKFQFTEPSIWFSPAFRDAEKFLDPGSIATADTIRRAVAEADIIEAHNMQFEFFVWKHTMPRYGFDMLPKEKLRCSAAKAAMYGLPRTLEGACAALGVRHQKDMEGSRLMLRLCKPRRPRKEEMLRDPDWDTRLYWYGTPEEFAREGQYCMQDVRAEESLSDALPDLPSAEQKLWLLDLNINDRGILVDSESCRAVLDVVESHSAAMTKEFRTMTQLASPRQRDATLRLLQSLGAQMEGLTRKDVDAALQREENPTVKRILEIRSSLSKSSTAKYQTFLKAQCTDGRIRGSLMYHGAGTGRWTGKLIQPQNFPRGTFPDTELCIRFFRERDIDSVKMFYGDPMVAASTCIRGMIVPAPGHDFVCADFSSIEGRVLAWLAGEETALDVYRHGRDPYKVAASAIYGVAYEDVQKPQRQVGKTAELALGYQGAVAAFSRMGENYGVSLPEDEVRNIVENWRDSRPRTVRLWRELEAACLAAVDKPGTVYAYRDIKFVVRGKFLAMRLPSGRRLWYMNPRIEDKAMSWGGMKGVIAIDGVDSVTRKWTTQYLYGGLLTENATQATARDLLVNAMWNEEGAGYSLVFHVHDELIAEVPESFGSVEEFESLMCQAPAWAEGLPLKAEGWRGKRYRK